MGYILEQRMLNENKNIVLSNALIKEFKKMYQQCISAHTLSEYDIVAQLRDAQFTTVFDHSYSIYQKVKNLISDRKMNLQKIENVYI